VKSTSITTISVMSIPVLQKTIQVLLLCRFTLLLYPSLGSSASLAVHDESFTPDITLHITLQTIQLNCWHRLSLLVNGTYPGPAIHLNPEETTWVRVYNDADVNFTMVSEMGVVLQKVLIVTALAWSFAKHPPLLGWQSAGKPVANPTESLLRLRAPP
jgi:hypothetical protein